MVNYKKLPTEQQNPLSKSLDTLSIEAIVRLMNREDKKIALAVEKEIGNISRAVKLIVASLKSGGRIIFAGAGTSGRLGVMESAELPPTFNTPPQLAQAIMAGGRKAVFRSQEGAEDNESRAKKEIREKARKNDVVIGIAASGVTPFVRSALVQAKKMGAKTIFITCNFKSPFRNATIIISPNVGPEIIAGSTRLKSATATKMVLNMLTTTAMIRLGKVYRNKMVDLQPKSKKLRERGIALVQELAHLSRKDAEKYFRLAKRHVKTAILMSTKNLTYAKAVREIEKIG